MSERMDRLEEQEARGSQRRRRGRGHKRCHRCQQPGHIARHCRAPAPIPAGRRQPSVAANPAPEIYARDSATVERDERSNGVDRESVRSLTDTSSNAAAVSQVSPNKSRGQRRRARRKTASPRSSDEMPDPEDPEAGCVAVSCRRPTNTVPRVAPVESSRLCQSIASGTLKASAIRDASQQEAPRCLSTGGIG